MSDFFMYCALFVIAYGIQGGLQAGYIRKYDALSVGVIRNLSLIVTMAPVLIFVPMSDMIKALPHLHVFLLASVVGALGLWGSFSAAQYLPIGVGTALRHMTHAITAVLLGAFMFSEYLEPLQLLFLGCTVATGIALILLKVDYSHLNPAHVGRGILLTTGAGVIVALSFFLFSALARDVHPFVVAYAWESGVGMTLFGMYVLRNSRQERPTWPVRKDFCGIVTVSLLTIMGTIAYALAVNSGPYALASGLMSLTTVVAVILAWFLYNEKLTRIQIFLLGLAIFSTVMLKVVS